MNMLLKLNEMGKVEICDGYIAPFYTLRGIVL